MDLNQDPCRHSARSVNAFTLIEILVTIIIIGLLAALFGAVFGRARSSAKSSACADNLHQISAGLVMYAGENGGYAPPVLTRTVYSADSRKKILGDIKRWRDLLQAYTRSPAVFFCPADPDPGASTPNKGVDKVNSLYSSYDTLNVASAEEFGPNNSLCLNIDTPPIPALPYAQDRILFVPNHDHHGLGFNLSSFHGDRMNVVYLDGHTLNISVTGQS